MDYKQFFIELGRLLYAIAKSDGEVQKEEVEEFYKILKEELLSIEQSTDEFGTDRAFYSEFEFETLIDRNAKMNQTFVSFVKFLRKNKVHITDEIKQVCLKCVIRVAEAHEGIVMEEEFLINRLKDELDKI